MPKWLIILSLVVLTACSSLQPTDHTAGMVPLNPNLHVDPAMSPQRQQQLLRDIERSKRSIAHFFGGEMHSAPTIYACVTPQCLQKFSGNHPKIEAKALGGGTIVLAEAGCNETIITHEMTHIELHHRLGERVNLNHIPMWFDEGLAILVCKDPRYTQKIDAYAPDATRYLRTEAQWVLAVNNHRQPYQVSYQTVQKWYAQVGTSGLLQAITQMKHTGRFSLDSNDPRAFSNTIALH